ncbi:MAG: HipA N-terminal domain-containing protein, partial [Mogibacterium sp.]|nr:HipA N-terminal domain-containing protein [Mogibacterium sp.]
MSSDSKTIYVYDSFSREEDRQLGSLFADRIRGSEAYSFEFDVEWLAEYGAGTVVDPALAYYSGRQFSGDGNLFGIFKDAAPDRWGRTLMNRRERILAEKENRKPRKLRESDYLLGVFDETRMGGLRFKTEKDGEYLSYDRDIAVPPWTRLRTLEEASRNFEKEEGAGDEKWLKQLIQPGSSLGGARPKASVADEKENLWIAKFPSRHD